MSELMRIGILLVDTVTQAQVGLIEFSPSGMMVYKIIATGLHPFAMKSVDRFLSQNGMAEPLYRKYADRFDENKALPASILEEEAGRYADLIKAATPALSVGAYQVTAESVHFK